MLVIPILNSLNASLLRRGTVMLHIVMEGLLPAKMEICDIMRGFLIYRQLMLG
jgi:hypothetical protein